MQTNLAQGFVKPGFLPVLRTFEGHLASGEEIGAAFSVYHQGQLVVDLWGGLADARSMKPWDRDQLIVVFSVTKGLAAMALHLLAERGKLDWDAPVSSVWPEFGEGGKERMTMRTLFSHSGGLCALDERLSLEDCMTPERRGKVARALAAQRPFWEPGTSQGYHALTFGLYAREVIERLAGESAHALLRRELFEPLGADVFVATPQEEDVRVATLYPVSNGERVVKMLGALARGGTPEARLARLVFDKRSLPRRAFENPDSGRGGIASYNDLEARRAGLLSAGATASAHGLARAYLPFALGGEVEGRRYFSAESVAPLRGRDSFSECDGVLQKPLGWTRGFLKEDGGVFSPDPDAFGHAGMGGALGWCDPKHALTIGYVTNRMDWRIRSPRIVALCRALYGSPGLG